MADSCRVVRSRSFGHDNGNNNEVHWLSVDLVCPVCLGSDFSRNDFVQGLRSSLVQMLGRHYRYDAL